MSMCEHLQDAILKLDSSQPICDDHNLLELLSDDDDCMLAGTFDSNMSLDLDALDIPESLGELPMLDLSLITTGMTSFEAAVADETAAFVHHINGSPSLASSSCASPITEILLTPTAKSKKPLASRPKNTPPRCSIPATDADCLASDSNILRVSAGELDPTETKENAADAADDELPAMDNELQEHKRSERIRRNRESAAQSRKRKRQHVEELEALAATLRSKAQSLREQNVELRHKCALVKNGSDVKAQALPSNAETVVV